MKIKDALSRFVKRVIRLTMLLFLFGGVPTIIGFSCYFMLSHIFVGGALGFFTTLSTIIFVVPYYVTLCEILEDRYENRRKKVNVPQ